MDNESPHILVVDDNALNRDMLSRRLAKRGYRTSLASTGAQALELIETTSFDLVLLDVMMPGIGGLEVLESVRKTLAANELPIIMVTAKDQSEDIVAALHLGANDYVTKPLDFPVVLARCRTQLSLRKATLQVAKLNEDLEARNRFIRNAFGRYVSDEVMRSVLDSPDGLKLGGEKRVATLMMADLRGFATMCEQISPEKVVRILNLYLGSMTDVIVRYGGTIDEFIGDGIFVIFGAPSEMDDHPCRAVACALAMQLALDAVNDQLESENLPRVQMGIGIHTGEVVVGNVGSERRAKFGAVGRNVNVTGRIETFSVGGQVLISEATRRLLEDDAVCSNSLTMEGKGLSAPIELFEVRGLRSMGLELSDHADDVRELSDALPVVLTDLDGKHLTAESRKGRIVGISRTSAEIISRTRPSLWTNVKLSLDSFEDGEDVYAKVVRHGPGEDRFLVRFTSFSDGLVRALADVG